MPNKPKLSGRVKDEEGKTNSPKLGRAGFIKIGEKRLSKSGNEYPAALDYFRMDARSDYVKNFHEAYGEKPKKLEIVFISDRPQDSCFERYELRDGKGKVYGLSDGLHDNASVWIYKDGSWMEISPEKRQEYGGTEAFMQQAVEYCESKNGWQHTLRLRFVIMKLDILALFELNTKGSESSIKNIVGTFDLIQKNNGTVVMIPFDLTVEMAKSDKSNDKRKYPVLSLVTTRGTTLELDGPEPDNLIEQKTNEL